MQLATYMRAPSLPRLQRSKHAIEGAASSRHLSRRTCRSSCARSGVRAQPRCASGWTPRCLPASKGHLFEGNLLFTECGWTHWSWAAGLHSVLRCLLSTLAAASAEKLVQPKYRTCSEIALLLFSWKEQCQTSARRGVRQRGSRPCACSASSLACRSSSTSTEVLTVYL